MKRKLLLLLLATTAGILCGCESKDNDEVKAESKIAPGQEAGETKDSNYAMLTEEQKKYLSQVEQLTEDAIDEMDYEAINWHLLGTGLELYNPSSGVEKNGITYQGDFDANKISESSPIIGLDKVLQIRLKEKDMRLEDFAEFQYEIHAWESEPKDVYVMELPLNGYENTFVDIVFAKTQDGMIEMKVPHIIYKGNEENWTFSILYDQETFHAFFGTEPAGTVEGKAYMGIQYGSVTEDSFVLTIYNWKNEKCKLSKNYELYEVSEAGETLITSVEDGEEMLVKENSYSIEGVKLKAGVKLEKDKTYVVKYGSEKDGYLYDEIEFQR